MAAPFGMRPEIRMRPKILDASWGWEKGNLGKERQMISLLPLCRRPRMPAAEIQAVMTSVVVKGIPACCMWRRG